MGWAKYVLLGYFLFALITAWYMVDRPRNTYGAGVAFLSTLVLGALTWLVIIA
jgi:hypothetical protein